MDVTPTSGSPKHPRAKGAVKADAPKPVRKTLTTSRKKATSPGSVVAVTPQVPLDVTSWVATAAFYLAAERNFAPGHELDDWLEAERRVRALHPTLK